MDKKVELQLEKLIPGLADYQIVIYPKSALDTQRELSVIHFEGITEQSRKEERLMIIRKGTVSEIGIARHTETKFEYGDFRHDVEDGEPIRKHLNGDEDAILIVCSEFSTKPKGPHVVSKIIEVYENR